MHIKHILKYYQLILYYHFYQYTIHLNVQLDFYMEYIQVMQLHIARVISRQYRKSMKKRTAIL